VDGEFSSNAAVRALALNHLCGVSVLVLADLYQRRLRLAHLRVVGVPWHVRECIREICRLLNADSALTPMDPCCVTLSRGQGEGGQI